jgi:7,8-dihydropterin-6-yl-methyl-4-(beta-D-ribofuranosyl)aminobenzene 5'-phosphate synthase
MSTFSRLTGLILFLTLVLSTITAREPAANQTQPSDSAVHITIIYDNYKFNPSLQPDWGFACMVEYLGNRLLFDTGRVLEIYRKNAQALHIQPADFPSLFISHAHGDHTAGIPWVLEENPSINCYLPSTYEEQLKSRGQLPTNHKGFDTPAHMYGPFYSTGDHFKAFNEQGLVIKTDKGGILVTGCGHPGVVEMVMAAKEGLGIDVYAVIGGLHLMNTPAEKLEEIARSLKELGVRKICPTHCTGDQAIDLFKVSFEEGYIAGGTGRDLTF